MSSPPSNSATPSPPSTAIANAIEVLYPSRYSQPHHNLNLDPIRNNHKRRFSPLLLEHGERELQDWGVVASSSSSSRTTSSVGSPSRSCRRLSSSSSMTSNNSNNSSGTGIRMMGKHGPSKRKKKKATKGPPIEPHPSISMKTIDGRLRLCSKSIVFEPDDVSRGIIRLPFEKMVCEPLQQCQQQNGLSNSANVETANEVTDATNVNTTATSALFNRNQQQQNQQRNKNAVIIKCNKFLVMKKNNVIGPYDIVEVLTEFRFTFLHSNPINFLDLGKKIYQIVHNKPCHIPPFTGTTTTSTTTFTTTNNSNTTTTPIPPILPETPANSLESLLRPLYDKPFDPANYLSMREQPKTANFRTYLLSPLLSKPGCTIVTDQCLYFQPFNGVFSSVATKALHYKLDQIIGTARRYKGLNDSALELFFEDGPSVLLAFESWREREEVMHLLPRTTIRNSGRSAGDEMLGKVYCHTDREFILEAARAWIGGLIGNFEYLLALNSASGRSFRDLSRYPVFPWVLADYDSPKLDWSCCRATLNSKTSTMGSNAAGEKGDGGHTDKDITIAEAEAEAEAYKMFRDLTKPIGALNQERLEAFHERWKSMQEGTCDDIGFLYGTHYSAPGYCLYYLVRTMPEQMLCLQNGKYDAPDRLFLSFDQCYSSLLINQADLKECIPQFYDPKTGVDLLLNSSGLQLGVTQSGKRVGDVELPRWAKSPKDFLKKNRMALESDYCTRKLPHWIDLIFGEKSRGDKALKAMNLFHPFSYLSSEDLEKMDTDDERANAEFQATEFGICPDMLFRIGHPQRMFEGEVGDGSRGQHDAVQTELLLRDCLVVPTIARTRFMEDSDDDEQQQQQPKDSGNRGTWEMLDVPSIQTMNDKEVTSIVARQSQDETLSLGTKKGNSAWLPASVNMPQEDLENSSDVEDKEFNNDPTPIREQQQQQQQQQADAIVSTVVEDEAGVEVIKKITPLSLRGVGDTSSPRNSSSSSPYDRAFGSYLDSGTSSRNSSYNNHKESDKNHNSHPSSSTTTVPPSDTNDPQGWEFRLNTSKGMHGNAVSGCFLSLEGGGGTTATNSCITTTSLDGGLMVHTLPNSQSGQLRRRSFSSAAGRFYKNGKSNSVESNNNFNYHHKKSPQFHSFRSHESSDPLACLTLVGDSNGGLIAFAGGEEGIVLAYGINSACALASVNSHRDAVTGISLVPRSSSVDGAVDNNRRKSRCTHVMTTCSFDATVKLWSVAITEGETVSIDREPLVELFDADSTVVCVAVVDVEGHLVIAAGCSDGSFIVWVWKGHSGKEIIHKEDAKRGNGSCADLKWATNVSSGETFLYAGFDAGFGSGGVASYVLRNGGIYPISKLHIGSPVRCLSAVNGDIFAGCADGGLRLVPVGEGGHFDYNPRTWTAVNGTNSPGLTSLSATAMKTSTPTERIFMCATGAEDGTVALFQIRELS